MNILKFECFLVLADDSKLQNWQNQGIIVLILVKIYNSLAKSTCAPSVSCFKALMLHSEIGAVVKGIDSHHCGRSSNPGESCSFLYVC